MLLISTHMSSRILTIAASLLVAGCATNVSRFQMPGTDLTEIRVFHIRRPDGDSATMELHALVTSDLESRGYRVLTLDSSTNYGAAEKRFEYKADWAWDLSPYLLEFRVAVYDPDDDTLVAQAQSLQSSLVRKSNEVVVERAIAKLFDDPIPVAGEN